MTGPADSLKESRAEKIIQTQASFSFRKKSITTEAKLMACHVPLGSLGLRVQQGCVEGTLKAHDNPDTPAPVGWKSEIRRLTLLAG